MKLAIRNGVPISRGEKVHQCDYVVTHDDVKKRCEHLGAIKLYKLHVCPGHLEPCVDKMAELLHTRVMEQQQDRYTWYIIAAVLIALIIGMVVGAHLG